MTLNSARRSGLWIGFALVTAVLVACKTATPPEPVAIENTKEVAATVEAIDVSKRMLTLRDPSGEKVTFEVAPEVRNLEQVKTGDQVVARYYESLAAQLVARGDGAGSTKAPVQD